MSEDAFSHKWGETSARHGFTQIPNALLRYNTAVRERSDKLSPPCLLLLIVLESFAYGGKTTVHPSHRALTARTGMGKDSLISALKSLELGGWILVNRTKRKVNVYDLTPLYARIAAFSEEEITTNR